MKKIQLIIGAVFVLAMAAFFTITPLTSSSQKQIAQSATSIPADVSKILQNSCTGCHDAGGNGMAMSMWSYSSWDKYSAKKQSKKAKAMCNTIKAGMMPPMNVRQSDPSKIPTMEQTNTICNWASSLPKK
ncbi:MAG TPA: hypothetical protein PKI01_02805 [Bacteroidales bacterium]|nr:hypothetical protein [Bacteroidales bacterium]